MAYKRRKDSRYHRKISFGYDEMVKQFGLMYMLYQRELEN